MNSVFAKKILPIGLAPLLSVWAFGTHPRALSSGPQIGGEVYAFQPTHVTGADKGSNTCPVCKYGMQPAAQVWVNGDRASNVFQIARTLDAVIAKNGLSKFRAFFVFIPGHQDTAASMKSKLAAMAAEGKLKNVALTFLDGSAKDALGEYRINTRPEVKNTILVYVNRKVVANYVNFTANPETLGELRASVASAVSRAN